MDQLSRVDQEFEHDTVEAAKHAAMEEAAATGGRVFPCMVFRQGGRTMISTAFPFATIAKHAKPDPATPRGNPREQTNRPLIPEHAKGIRDYLLRTDGPYVLPPVTLNVNQIPQLHVHRTNAAVRSGHIVLDDSTRFYITDGQHRIAALTGYDGRPGFPGALAEKPELSADGLAVLIIVEPRKEQIHQDFADAAQTKAIPPSLLASFNMREPLNRVVTKIVDDLPLFIGRIDETSKTLPKQSQRLFLLNQVRGFVKELLVGDYAMAEASLARHSKQRLANRDQQDRFAAQALEYLAVLSAKMVPWRQIAELPVDGGPANQIPDFRAQYLNLTATGLVLLGRAGYEINKLTGARERHEKYEMVATAVDWRRSAGLWNGNVVSPDNKVSTHRGPVSRAAQLLLAELKLPRALEASLA